MSASSTPRRSESVRRVWAVGRTSPCSIFDRCPFEPSSDSKASRSSVSPASSRSCRMRAPSASERASGLARRGTPPGYGGVAQGAFVETNDQNPHIATWFVLTNPIANRYFRPTPSPHPGSQRARAGHQQGSSIGGAGASSSPLRHRRRLRNRSRFPRDESDDHHRARSERRHRAAVFDGLLAPRRRRRHGG